MEIVHLLDWVKLTARGNLLKTSGYYLQHSKDMLVIARDKRSISTEVSHNAKVPADKSKNATVKFKIPAEATKDDQTDRISFVMERQKLAGSKPIIVAEMLEQWFPTLEPRVELCAWYNDLRPSWFSVGTELNGPGLHAVKLPADTVPPKFRPI